MFFGISRYTNRKLSRGCIVQTLIQIFPLIHVHYLLHQVACMSMSSLLRNKVSFSFLGISPQGEYISNSEKMKINKCVFSFFFAEATTNDMRNCGYAILIIYCGRDRNGTGSFTYNM